MDKISTKAARSKEAIFWVVASCSLVEVSGVIAAYIVREKVFKTLGICVHKERAKHFCNLDYGNDEDCR
jgi:hypothetical protein